MDANPLIARMRHRWPLTESDFHDLRHLCRDVRALDRGDHIIGDGHRADRVHMIVSGWAARYKMLPNGGRQITALLLPGDLCNIRSTLLAATDQGIVALTPMQVAYILPDAIDAVERTSPRVDHALAWCSLVEQATLRAWIVNLGCRHALERVAHLLCELFERLSMTAVEGTGSLFYPLTQGEIADTVGLTPVHVNRILQDLRGRGMITSTRGHLVVRDLFGLQLLAGFNGAYLRPEMAPMSELVS